MTSDDMAALIWRERFVFVSESERCEICGVHVDYVTERLNEGECTQLLKLLYKLRGAGETIAKEDKQILTMYKELAKDDPSIIDKAFLAAMRTQMILHR